MPTESSPHYPTGAVDGVTVVTPTGPEILPETKDEFYALADRVAAGPAPKRLVLDVANVKVLRSVTIGVLINFQKRIREGGGSVKLCGLCDDVLNLFKLIRLDEIFEIYPDERAAVAAFQGKPEAEKGEGSWFSRLRG